MSHLTFADVEVILSDFSSYSWRHWRPHWWWYSTAAMLAREQETQICYDPHKKWQDSKLDFYKNGILVICVGGIGLEEDVCSALLHELGHCVIYRNQPQHMYNRMEEEIKAWEIAHGFAQKYKLPFSESCRNSSLSTYLIAEVARGL